MSDTLGYLNMFVQFPFALRRFLRRSPTLAEAESVVRQRMARRADNFLRIVERSVYRHPTSPYLALFKLAGCELGDLRALVAQTGVEGALRTLRAAGVYVTFDEFKGRIPIVRHGTTIPVTPRDFDNPGARPNFTMTTGGSTGLAHTVFQDLDYVAASALNYLLMLAAHGVLDAPMVLWYQILPAPGMHFLLQRAYLRQAVTRWFSSLGWRDSQYWIKYGLATLYMVLCMRAAGVRAPFPEIVRLDQAQVVARWMRDMLDTHSRCLLYANVSHALRVCVAAEQAGFDLTGATMRVGGEPITTAKAGVLRRVGVRVLPAYGGVDSAGIGLGCAQPTYVDEVHLATDAYALITHPYTVPGMDVTVPAFNLTTLLDSAPKLMLNYQSDDYGIIAERGCGCPLEAYGYTTHLHDIRSYSKLVGEGVTLIGNDMLRILETVLPARFGGSPLDYQLLEHEDAQGLTRLALIISPRLQIQDENEVVQVVLAALRAASPMADAARSVWQHAQSLHIKRMEPIATARGKLLPLHMQRSAPTPQLPHEEMSC